jgi:hypothetical protein
MEVKMLPALYFSIIYDRQSRQKPAKRAEFAAAHGIAQPQLAQTALQTVHDLIHMSFLLLQ